MRRSSLDHEHTLADAIYMCNASGISDQITLFSYTHISSAWKRHTMIMTAEHSFWPALTAYATCSGACYFDNLQAFLTVAPQNGLLLHNG